MMEVEAVINKFVYGCPKFYCANKVIINGDSVIEDGEKLRIKGLEIVIKSWLMGLSFL
jgi:hypothetical protein